MAKLNESAGAPAFATSTRAQALPRPLPVAALRDPKERAAALLTQIATLAQTIQGLLGDSMEYITEARAADQVYASLALLGKVGWMADLGASSLGSVAQQSIEADVWLLPPDCQEYLQGGDE
jgi:hypothetical protein